MKMFDRIRMWRKTQAFLGAFGPDPEKACAAGMSREDEIRSALEKWERERSELLPRRLERILRLMAEGGFYAMERRTAESFCMSADGKPGRALPWREGKAFSSLPLGLRKIAREYEKDAEKLSASADAALHWSGVFGKRRKDA